MKFCVWCSYIRTRILGKMLIHTLLFITKTLIQFIYHSSGGIALGYGLDDRGSRVRSLAGAGDFSLHHRVQNGSEAHPISYPMGIRGSFPGGKEAET
jgi:hypothetical protein